MLNSSSSEDINVLIVIDTDYVKKNFPNPSQDPNNPTGIDYNSQFMICADPRGIISGQGAVEPDNTSPNRLLAKHVVMDFINLDSKVAKGGTENFFVYFALYTLGTDGETQNLFGCYYWDPTITVQ